MDVEPTDRDLIQLLDGRARTPTLVHLDDGKVLDVINIAWGYDIGDAHAHVTTNVSPSPSDEMRVDVFSTQSVVQVVDPDASAVLWSRPAVT